MYNVELRHQIIGLCGGMGVGKDTVAQMLCKLLKEFNPSCDQMIGTDAFANPLKEILIDYFGFTHDDLYTQEGKMSYNDFWGMTNREAAQRFGTEAMRNGFHPDTWTKLMELRIRKKCLLPDSPPGSYSYRIITITDLRFENEAQLIKKLSGIIVKIKRPHANNPIENVGIQNHASEQGLPDKLCDIILHNNSTLEDLEQKVKTICEYICCKKKELNNEL